MPEPGAQAGITGVILAGGRARRMGGADKGLLQLAGQPMVARVARALRPQVGELLVSANRNPGRYGELCACRVLADMVEGYAGPLAGVAAGLAAARQPLVLVVPCDAPLLAPDLAERLAAPVRGGGADVAVASDGHRMQPVLAVIRRELRPGLEAYLEAGERRADRWLLAQRLARVPFPDRPEMFTNVNTPEDLEALAARLGDGGPSP